MRIPAIQGRGQQVMPGMHQGNVPSTGRFPGGGNIPGNLNSLSWMINNQTRENIQNMNRKSNLNPQNIPTHIPSTPQNNIPNQVINPPANETNGNHQNFNGMNPGNHPMGGMQPSNFQMGRGMNYPNDIMNNFNPMQR